MASASTTRLIIVAAAAAFGLGALIAVAAVSGSKLVSSPAADARGSGALWTEVAWPFPADEWGRGRAFVCKAADCGAETALYLRAKLGFCNCTTGVADDDELERIGDLHLTGATPSAMAAGQTIQVAAMKGRMRAYTVSGARSSKTSVLAIAFNDRCDVIVATVLVGREHPTALEQPVMRFLNGPDVVRWAEVTLGL
ncbi:MAG: hypothetical protein AB7K64_08940 [Variibacter sp.]